ncbi:hypothetical protein BW899_23645 [Bacillus mycoides]|nr:hypothetical protein BW899_23645 [Bacillus mycoides]
MPTAGSCYPIHMFNRYYNTFFSYIVRIVPNEMQPKIFQKVPLIIEYFKISFLLRERIRKKTTCIILMRI